ncbi:MAG: hypothetical protein ACFNLD_06090 [Kingella oralis]
MVFLLDEGWMEKWCWGVGWRFQAAFAKTATDGASAARRHLASQQTMLNEPFGDKPSSRYFYFQAAFGVSLGG